jgi:hypothetical protein
VGEIKSTIDLMMERTRGMSLTKEEKDKLHREDLEKRAKGYCLRLLSEESAGTGIIESLSEIPAGDRDFLLKKMWDNLVKEMPAGQETLKYLEVLEMLPQASTLGSVLHDFRSALNAALKNTGKDLKSVINQERKKLAAHGISGTAVIPKVSRETELERSVSGIVDEYRSRLEALP